MNCFIADPGFLPSCSEIAECLIYYNPGKNSHPSAEYALKKALDKLLQWETAIYIMMGPITEIKMYDADSFDYCGSILVFEKSKWDFSGVTDAQILEIGRLLPLKGVLQMLISLNIVYDILPLGDRTEQGITDA